MKKLTFLLIFSFSISTLLAQDFYLNSNGVTCMCPDAAVGDTGVVNGITYTKRTIDQITIENAATTCTSGIIDMSSMFFESTYFDEDITTWDVSNVINMSHMFDNASVFNQNISNWDVSNVTDMSFMFNYTEYFDQPIGNWDVSNVTTMEYMFSETRTGYRTPFNQDISNWDVGNVTNMGGMFFGAGSFNQPIGSWDVSNVTDMNAMFALADLFNQNISNWNVSNVTRMSSMFSGLSMSNTIFNQPISNWDVSNVTIMGGMFWGNTFFNQDISSWNVSNVTSMFRMFKGATAFNQPIGDWNLSNVENLIGMFEGAINFNQNISNWDVSNVIDMSFMFSSATNFNQNIDAWQFYEYVNLNPNFINYSGLDVNNYDLLLDAFYNQNLLNNTLQAGNLFYCNITTRNNLINNGWEISGDSYNFPFLTAPDDLIIETDFNSCIATAVDLGLPTVFGGCGELTISNDAPSEFPIGTTQVSWQVLDENGTESPPELQTIIVNLPVDIANMCYVSSDLTAVTNNRIYITTDTDNSGINVEYHEVLRETPSGNYETIGFVNPPEVSFLDIDSDNTSQAYRYKIQTTDVCGASYPDSSFHKTILLQSGIASDNSINLSWTPYLGLDFSTYNIYKNTNGTGYELLTSLSFNNTTYNDTAANVLDNAYEYYIAIEAPDCNTDPLMSEFIKSNLEYVNPNLGSNDLTYLENAISLFPNPTSNQVEINTSNDIDIIKVELYNLLGQQIAIATNNSIEMSFLPSGLYYLQIATNLGTVTKTVIRK